MSKGFFSVPRPVNEPVLSYAPGTGERAEVKAMIAKMRSEIIDIPMFIGGNEIRTNDKREIRAPHEIKHLLGYYYQGEREHVVQAIDAALSVRRRWQDLP